MYSSSYETIGFDYWPFSFDYYDFLRLDAHDLILPAAVEEVQLVGHAEDDHARDPHPADDLPAQEVVDIFTIDRHHMDHQEGKISIQVLLIFQKIKIKATKKIKTLQYDIFQGIIANTVKNFPILQLAITIRLTAIHRWVRKVHPYGATAVRDQWDP